MKIVKEHCHNLTVFLKHYVKQEVTTIKGQVHVKESVVVVVTSMFPPSLLSLVLLDRVCRKRGQLFSNAVVETVYLVQNCGSDRIMCYLNYFIVHWCAQRGGGRGAKLSPSNSF